MAEWRPWRQSFSSRLALSTTGPHSPAGEPALDDYLRRRAAQDVRRRVARALVALERASGTVAGYYTLSAASFARQQLPEAVARRLLHYPVPAAILGRLAVDQRYQGRGLGELMLAGAIKRVPRGRGCRGPCAGR
jgi:GNAT superfamily N-acetyltransferase